jgi:hypothetical protein
VWGRVSSKRSNFIFGLNRNKPKLNLFRLFFGLFRETKKQFFRFVSVFRTVIETTETNRTLSKQTETNKKKSPKKRFLLGGPRNCKFFSRFKLKQIETQPVSVCFFAKPKSFFSVCFGVSDWYQNNQNKQNLWYGE